ncbi:MAG: STAS/SEC14 domain-containing protein [Armatimonadetes bacterium CG_4_10_14_3_um_filter_66_18]|nr:STAS/SEC14 domain-containing protein [Armatimonadota bacterium]OIP02847.1 MAG: hypothetical protein AUJ96_15810 [Armatimonadetes bacterium CG2_30_66_41]PIU92423.1 MAG: STAS/SEC14 domain-containing protein [Armatimonadetes bacterium CG06_land_8_20_14_3_00_66_21]PIX44564.1 MAG: STAS/SEC14 domain-containing protein [Armatimonadetes bacterium CG_4_8_14_3_um_filter_66_20]PIY36790.1 MAG: STAS/SEC14 domain-containing protein [Armatimonadetes bacterium CG_4_10_14_3_um_filter_66_18]PIZ33578.1 MAG: S
MATTVQTRAPALLNELLRGAERLSAPQLDAFVCRVVALRAQRFAPSLPRDEADLLTKVNRALPPAAQRRFDELVAKRQAETLTENERHELVELTDLAERTDAERVKCLVELAHLRGTTLPTLMDDLGIRPPTHA